MSLKNTHEDKTFASVLADGKIHVSVPEGTEGALKREYETSDGKVGSKYEFVYTELAGMITKIEFHEGDFGKSLNLTVVDGDEKPVVLTLSTASNFGEDMMKKLLNIDMDLPVILAPYSFVDDKGKNKRGITVTQEGKKIQNYFYDFHKKVNINGYPEPKKSKKPLSKDQWKMYFMEARMFLIDTITEHFKLEETVDSKDKALDNYGKDIEPEDIDMDAPAPKKGKK